MSFSCSNIARANSRGGVQDSVCELHRLTARIGSNKQFGKQAAKNARSFPVPVGAEASNSLPSIRRWDD